jgi:MbtH protein
MSQPDDDGLTYLVVVNDEEQYSLWPAHRELPAGWAAEGTEGGRSACLERISAIWHDVTPRSVRLRMAGERV